MPLRSLILSLLVAAVVLPACTPSPERLSSAPSADTAGSKGATRPPAEPAVPPVASLSSASPAPAAPINFPANALYVCVTEAGGASRQATIEFEPAVGALCSRHPEMGPCRYERDVCRRGGGRVYAAQGTEITLQTEAEYDKKVMRVRLQAN
jgi:hypothetical protein